MKKIKIGIVWANPYNKNMGVAALAYSALSIIHDVLKTRGIEEFEVSFIGSSKNTSDSLVIGTDKIEFDNVFGFDFYNFKAIVKFLLFPRKYKLRKLIGFDYLFDIAEGDSFTDIYGDKRFNKIKNSKVFFNLLGTKQFLLPQTIGPFKDKNHEKKAFLIMNKMEAVVSRDNKSFLYTKNHLSATIISESIDVAFYLPFDRKHFDKTKINVGINVSGLLWNGGYTRNNQFNLKTNFKKLIFNTLRFFYEKENVQIYIVSHVVPGKSQEVEDDYYAAEELQKTFPNVILAPRFSNPIEAKSFISGLDFFTGARMHACIAAFSSSVAVCPMAYSRKFNGLFVDTLKYKWLGDCVNSEEVTVLNNIINAFENRVELVDAIDTSLNEIVYPRIKLLKLHISNIIN
ncbi:polysaccharide pyruvyl transferase family protein [Flavicella sp.]|uniref:polysaccharide pyruvyl transferase family protein n=1 Tax=Flavicella sp. TaxID=2957742 RepID=UPI0030164E16